MTTDPRPDKEDDLEACRKKLEQSDAALREWKRLAIERLDELRELHENFTRTDIALAKTQKLAFERFDELQELHENLTRANAALAKTQELAVERNKLIQELSITLDYDVSEAIQREKVAAVLKIRVHDGVNPLDSGETEGDMPSAAATRNDVLLAYRRIMRRLLTSEDQINAHLEQAASLRSFIRDLVGTVSPEIISGPLGPLSKPMFDDRDYLAVSFSDEERYNCFVHNYRFVTEHLSDSALRQLLRDGVPIYWNRLKTAEYSILMNIPPRGAFEGEFSIVFRSGDKQIYASFFSFVPGYVVGLEDPNIILVGSMQGKTRSPELIREAAKDNADVSPAAILFAAIQGVARATGVQRIVSVASRNLVSFKGKSGSEITNAYDSFFATLGAIPLGEGFFVWSTDTPEKPLNMVKPGHRLRTKAKRRFKAEVVRQVSCAWPVLLDPAYQFLQIADRATGNPSVRRLIREARTVARVLEGMDKTIARLVASLSNALKVSGAITSRRDFQERVLRWGVFDEDFYLTRNPDVARAGVDPIVHYLERGASEGRDPSAFFVTRRYFADNPDVAESGMNPLVHYCLYGAPAAASVMNRYGPIDESLEFSATSNPGGSDVGLSETVLVEQELREDDETNEHS